MFSEFHWWVVALNAAVIWVGGWLITTVSFFFFDPLTSAEEKRKEWRGRLISAAVINWIIWPWFLPAFWRRYWFYQDMRTGKRPNWLIRARDEKSGQTWVLSDGTECGASAEGGTSTEPSRIAVHYTNHRISGLVEYRIRKVAPVEEEFSEWRPMSPDETDLSDEEDGFIDYESKYEISLQLSRGKYRTALRFQNRAGKMEEQSELTLIVADHEEYDDA